VVHGKIAGEPVSLPLDIVLPDRNDEIAGEALPIVWARAQVKDRMTRYLRPDIDDGERTRLKAEVTELGLAHRLITQWTAFVAVSKRVINPEGAGWPVDVAVSQVKGVPDTAYPPGALPKHASLHAARGSSLKAPGFGGGFDAFSGPEPSTWLALLGIALTAALCYRKRLSVTLRN
jgi:Ca-activated chloride channel family protein